jgi:hypothetical protein
MKVLPGVLVLSLAANCAWLGLSLRGQARGLSGTNPPTGHAPPASAPRAANRPGSAVAPWARVDGGLQTANLGALIEQLRAAGLSQAEILAVVNERVAQEFAARRAALRARQSSAPFWKDYPADVLAEERALARAIRTRVREILGPDGYIVSEEMRLAQRRRFGDLPDQKLDQLQHMFEDYDELRARILDPAKGMLTADDRAKLALLSKEQSADLNRLLTPAEVAELSLRNGPRTAQLKTELGAFTPTDAEFRALLQARDSFERAHPTAAAAGVDHRWRETLARVLGPARNAELETMRHPNYAPVSQITERLGLPEKTALDLIAYQQEVMRRVIAIRTDTTTPDPIRRANLAALAQQSSDRVRSALGTAGYELYTQHAGDWLKTMSNLPKAHSNPPPVSSARAKGTTSPVVSK